MVDGFAEEVAPPWLPDDEVGDGPAGGPLVVAAAVKGEEGTDQGQLVEQEGGRLAHGSRAAQIRLGHACKSAKAADSPYSVLDQMWPETGSPAAAELSESARAFRAAASQRSSM